MKPPPYRKDGFQFGLDPADSCHCYTITDPKSPANGFGIAICGPEDTEPDESTILKAIKRKEGECG